MITLDSGKRPSESVRNEVGGPHLGDGDNLYPAGQNQRSRRHLPMSERGIEALKACRNGQTEGWIFPSDSACGHIVSVAK